MQIKLLYFAQISEKTGVSNEILEVADDSTSDVLLEILYTKYPALKGMTFKLAVDQNLINSSVKLKTGDEVALLPPFAGG